jgi:hypothetical protein
MKKTLVAMGTALFVLGSFAPASAASLKEKVGNTLFGGQTTTIYTVDDRPLLSAEPRGFGLPVQIGGLGSFIASALGSEILSESGVVPVPASSAGFTYEFNPSLNIFERKSIGLGAIFNERVNTLGRGGFAFGVAYVRQDFDEYNGEDISNLRMREGLFATRPFLGGLIENGSVEATLDLDITTNTAAIWAIYGLTDWLDISFLLPITEIDLRARSTVRQVSDGLIEDLPAFLSDSQCTPERAERGQCRIADFTIIRQGTPFSLIDPDTLEDVPSFSDTVDETRWGVGDLILRGKARFLEGAWGAFGGLTEFTFPSGSKDDFLGDDAFKARFLLLYSTNFWKNRVNFHLNGGGRVTSETSHKNTLEYGSAVDVMVTERLSLVAEMTGSWRVDPRLDSGGLLPSNFIDGAFGFKVNPFGGLIVSASFRIPATDDGLRSDLVYLAGLEYDF